MSSWAGARQAGCWPSSLAAGQATPPRRRTATCLGPRRSPGCGTARRPRLSWHRALWGYRGDGRGRSGAGAVAGSLRPDGRGAVAGGARRRHHVRHDRGAVDRHRRHLPGRRPPGERRCVGSPARLPGAGSADVVAAAAPSSSTGPMGLAGPDGLAQYWPGGDPELLRVAAGTVGCVRGADRGARGGVGGDPGGLPCQRARGRALSPTPPPIRCGPPSPTSPTSPPGW